MIHIDIPPSKQLLLSHLVLDYNGTIARDGELLDGVGVLLEKLARKCEIHVISADTHGTVAEKLAQLPVRLHIVEQDNQEHQKEEYVLSLVAERVAAVGNGAIDRLMLKQAGLGIAVIEAEGAAVSALLSADVICTSIHDALELLLYHDRLRATLRNG